jgi:nitrogen fixation NifU-like protein
MAFSPKYLDHFSNPRGLGEVEPPRFEIDVEHQGGGCFDKIHLTVRIEEGMVVQARFRARACSGTIATCSALTQLIEGKEVSTLSNLSAEDVAAYLDGIPSNKQHSADLVVHAWTEILKQFNSNKRST